MPLLEDVRRSYEGLPAKVRGVMLALGLLALAFVPIFWGAVGTGCLLALMVLSGMLVLNAARAVLGVLVSVPLIIGLALVRFDWSHPFASAYLVTSLTLPVCGLVVDAFRLEEWIACLRRFQLQRHLGPPARMASSALVGAAMGRVGVPQMGAAITRARRDAQAGRWTGGGLGGRVLDNLGHQVYVAVQAFEAFATALSVWRASELPHAEAVTIRGEADTDTDTDTDSNASSLGGLGQTPAPCRLDDIYLLPGFDDMLAEALPSAGISSEWRKVVEAVAPGTRILEIGPGRGRLTELLMLRGAQVTAVEQDVAAAEYLARHARAIGAHLTVVKASFPVRGLGEYDLVVLHQNVFLELINELGLEPSCDALRGCTNSRGEVVLDYPTSVTIHEGLLYDGPCGDAHVRYGFQGHMIDGETHEVSLRYVLTESCGASQYVLPLRFSLPDVGVVEKALAVRGLISRAVWMSDMPTFFQGRMRLFRWGPSHAASDVD